MATLDVLIGFALVMLVMSMAVTIFTDLIGSILLNLRGKALKLGIARLIRLLSSSLCDEDARQIADKVLRDPLVGKPRVFGVGNRLTDVVHREELVKLLLAFATGGQADGGDTQSKFRKVLAENGIEDPSATLQQIRNATLELEKTSPELSQSARLSVAILNFAASEFLSKLNSWFDQTIDRVSEMFTARARLVAALVALVIAFVTQLDSIQLLNRLSVDDQVRGKLVEMAIEKTKTDPTQPAQQTQAQAGQGQTGATSAGASGTTSAATGGATSGPSSAAQTATTDDKEIDEQVEEAIAAAKQAGAADLEELGLIMIPRSFEEWKAGWSPKKEQGAAKDKPQGKPASDDMKPGEKKAEGQRTFSPTWFVMHLFGILLTAGLLSLGGPFWYAALRDLLKLRSVISKKDDAERAERQSTQTPSSTGGASAALRSGEAGDLAAAG